MIRELQSGGLEQVAWEMVRCEGRRGKKEMLLPAYVKVSS